VTPYLDDVQARINANYEKAGFTVVADRHLRMQDNFSFSTVTGDQMRDMTRAVAAAKPDAIAIVCTNMRGAPLAAELEAQHGIPVYDTVSTTVWKSLRLAGVDTRRVKGWGKIFDV
jgi:maleate isomerase